jgi:hypothetical protein
MAYGTFEETDMGTGVRAGQHSEGSIAKVIEEPTARLPSDLFLWAALGSVVCSSLLHAKGETHKSLFVGQLAPTFLILGLYNKLVKLEGSERR